MLGFCLFTEKEFKVEWVGKEIGSGRTWVRRIRSKCI